MSRALMAAAALAAFSTGCPKAEDPPPAEQAPGPCHLPEGLNLTSCNLESLASFTKPGVYTLRIRNQFSPLVLFVDSVSTMPGNQLMFGDLPLEDVVMEDQRFSWSVRFKTSQGDEIQYALAGCNVRDQDELEVRGNVCVNGTMRARLSVDAYRITRRAGEAEAQNVSLVGETRLEEGSRAVDVAVAGPNAYVAGGLGGLTVVDIADRAAPVLLTRVSADGDLFNDVVVKGDRAFVASADGGVLLFDITNPAAPQLRGAVPADMPNVHTLHLDGDRLYAFSPDPDSETIIFDVSTPSAPVELSRFRAANPDPFGDHPHDGTVFEDRLYVNHWARGTVVAQLFPDAGARPVELARIPGTEGTSHASAVGRIDGGVFLFEGGEELGADLRIFDVTNPKSSVKVGGVQLGPRVSIHNMTLTGTRLYVAWYQYGLRVFDVSNPASPLQAGYFNTWRETDKGRGSSFFEGATGVLVPGDGFIYVAESTRGLMIFKEP